MDRNAIDSRVIVPGHNFTNHSFFSNPVRAGMATSPEASDYTGIKQRIHPVFKLTQAIDAQQVSGGLLDFKAPLKPLLCFEGGVVDEPQSGILFAYRDYLELVDWSGRIARDDKRGCVDHELPPILKRFESNYAHFHSDKFDVMEDRGYRFDQPMRVKFLTRQRLIS